MLIGINGFLIVKEFILFGSDSSQTVAMTVTAVVIVAMYGLVFLRTRDDASILTSSIASLYVLYL